MEFGEMTLLDEPRTADVWADTNVACLELPIEEFNRFRREHPQIAERIARNLAGDPRQAPYPGQRQDRSAQRLLNLIVRRRAAGRNRRPSWCRPAMSSIAAALGNWRCLRPTAGRAASRNLSDNSRSRPARRVHCG